MYGLHILLLEEEPAGTALRKMYCGHFCGQKLVGKEIFPNYISCVLYLVVIDERASFAKKKDERASVLQTLLAGSSTS
jgi:hypothetical protein